MTPLRENWAKISDIILDTLKLGLRYDIKTRKVKIHVSITATWFCLLNILEVFFFFGVQIWLLILFHL